MAVPVPFTWEHFEGWCGLLVLDSGDPVSFEPFQRAFVVDVFGGRKVCWLVLPEGNGKTTLLAALGLYALRFSGDASIPIAASKRDQVRIMYRQMRGFVKRAGLDLPDEFGVWFECFDGYREIQLRTAGGSKRGEVIGRIEVHAADAGTADGVIPFPYAFLDELHRHQDLSLHRTWTGKLDKRDAQLIVISTAGAPGHEFETTRAAIRDQATETTSEGAFSRYASDRVVLHDWAVVSDEAVGDLAAVKAANPLAKITVEGLAAKLNDPTMTANHWRRFTCNLATMDDSADLFVDADTWNGLADGNAQIPFGAPVCIGADGSRTWDTTVVAWAHATDDRIDVAANVFSVRADEPHHSFHEGGRIDFDDVESFLLDLFARFDPTETAYDPRYLERSMELVDRRLPSAAIFPVQPHSKLMRDALQAFYTAVVDGKLRHLGDPILAAHLANTKVERDPQTREIRRIGKIDQRKPIDAVPAMALAVWRASVGEPGSVYSDRGMVTI